MINVLVSGCNGKMGSIVANLLEQSDDFLVFGGFDKSISEEFTYRTFTKISEIEDKPDVIIDFSVPQATFSILDYAVSKEVPIVIATTGFTDEEILKIQEASTKIPIFRASNMSLSTILPPTRQITRLPIPLDRSSTAL